jgi:DNA-binding NarL/FixJ family response regulator
LLRLGKRRDGQAELETALEITAETGDRPLAERIAAELEVAGAAPKRLSFDEMTASERRVAELAAAGKTNREIASELFVTPKTVENHLTRVYAKLGVSSRRALADSL